MYQLWIQDRFWNLNLKEMFVSMGGIDCQVQLTSISSNTSTAEISKFLNSLNHPCWFSPDDITVVFEEFKHYCEEACFRVFRDRKERVPVALVTRFDDEWVIQSIEPGLDSLPVFANHEKWLTEVPGRYKFDDVDQEIYFYKDGQICSSDGKALYVTKEQF